MNSAMMAVARKVHEAVWFLFLVAGVWLAKKYMEASLLEVVAGLIFTLALYITYLFVDELRGRIVERRLPWLYNTGSAGAGRSLDRVEREIEAGSVVYLITPDLYNDARNSKTIDAVTSNLNRGVTYRYLTRNDDLRAKRNIEIIQRNFAKFGEQIEIYAVNEMFRLMPTYNVLVLEQDAVGILRVFLELPVKDNSDSRSLRFLWAEADSELGNRWHGRILDLLKGRAPLSNPFLDVNGSDRLNQDGLETNRLTVPGLVDPESTQNSTHRVRGQSKN